jgi:endoglucanase
VQDNYDIGNVQQHIVMHQPFNQMKVFRVIQAVWVVLFVISFMQPVSAQNKLARVSVEGNKFVADGKTLVFRGLNVSDPDKLTTEGHWNERHFKEIKSWGANIVRFPVHPAAWRKRGEKAYLALLDKGVAMAEAQGIYVIIDWHSIGNLRTEMYQSPMYETTQKETYEFWRTIAKHYKDNTAVAFFELFNEPTEMGGELGTCSWDQWASMMEEIIGIVRACKAPAIPLVAGFNWAYDLKEVANRPIRAADIGYVSHPYPQKRQKPWETQWTEDWGYVANKYPVILTEIGFSGADDKGAHIPVISDESYGDAITAYTAARGISYVVWVFDPGWSPMLVSDWNYTLTRQGKYFKEAMKN